MQMPAPDHRPMPLPPQVTGSLSRLQGLLQAAHPQVQNAYAMHWLALRQAGFVPEFQRFTQHMLWGAYGNLALGGLIRHALTGRSTPEVMGGIVDQLHLIQEHYGRAAQALEQFLERPDARELPAVQPMAAALRPLDQVYQNARQPMERAVDGVNWLPGPLLDLPQIRAAIMQQPGEAQGAGGPEQG